MLVVEIVLDDELREELEIVAEIMGVSLEVLVVMACQKYVQWINEQGFPRIVGLRLTVEGESAELGPSSFDTSAARATQDAKDSSGCELGGPGEDRGDGQTGSL